MENNNLPDIVSLVNGEVKQVSSTLKTPQTPGSENQHEDSSQSEGSEDIEDVKVCDICGDAGQEELLAICSRCSDGAEHTYCMQKKMKELPVGDWLCEECKLKEETGNQDANKSETEAESLKGQLPTKNNQNTKSDFDPEYLPELDTKEVDSEEKGARDRPQSKRISTKREEDDLEVDLKTGKKVLELSTRRDDAKNKSFLLREDSFSSTVADKAKQAKPMSVCGGQSVNNSSLARSQTFSGANSSIMLDPLQSSRGPLLKSGSFNNTNMKHKVQFIDNIPPPKQNMSRQFTDARKAPVKKMNEPASMKSNRPGCSNAESITIGSHDGENSGCNEVNSSHATKTIGCSSSILTASKPCQTIPMDNIHEILGNASSHLTSPQVARLPQGNDKIKEGASLGIPKQPVSGVSGLLRCLKCNKTGHPTQFCSINKLPMIALKTSADRNARERHNKNAKTKDAADAPILKSIVEEDTGFPCHPTKLLLPGVNSSYEVPSKDLGSVSSSYLRNSTQFERKTYSQASLRSNIVADPTKMMPIDVNPKVVQVEPLRALEENNLNPTVTISDKLYTACLPQILPNAASIPVDILRSTAIPELEFIWQGDLKILRCGGLLKSCEGVQAHLSTFASPKVFEAATKFPYKVQLEEVTYLSSWPREYWGHSPGEHNIGLFFFAKDVESYEKNYSKLLEDMIVNDLALRGNIAGAELLVFPSNKLPQNSQRWNRLFFLWGVFLGRRPDCSETKSQLEEKPSMASLDSEMLTQKLLIPIPEVSTSQQLNYSEILIKETSSCNKSTGMDANLSSFKVENKNNFHIEGREVIPLQLKEKMEAKGSSMKSDELTDFNPSRKRSAPISIEAFSLDGGGKMERKKMMPENRGHGCRSEDESSSHSLSSAIYPDLFPMELGAARGVNPNKAIQCSDGKGFRDIPNLELALGATTKLPEDKFSSMPSANPRDDVAASLDLSLAFGPAEKEP